MKLPELEQLIRKAKRILPREEYNNVEVLVPTKEIFDGYFFSPCMGESGINEAGINEDSTEARLDFLLVPHGFFDEPFIHEVDPTLN